MLFDTNVILDLLLDRHPFSKDAAALISQVEQGRLEGYLGATTVTTIHYLLRKALGLKKAELNIGKLLVLFDVAGVDKSALDAALGSSFADFEDAALYQAALNNNVEAIVTRDKKGFAKSKIPLNSPHEMIAIIRSEHTSST